MYEYKANCTAVYDGDTITVDIDLGFGVWLKKQKMRLSGINAPEMRGADKAAGKVSRDYLRSLVLDKEVRIETSKLKGDKGKYGRWIATIWVSVPQVTYLNVCRKMVKEGHAVFKNYG